MRSIGFGRAKNNVCTVTIHSSRSCYIYISVFASSGKHIVVFVQGLRERAFSFFLGFFLFRCISSCIIIFLIKCLRDLSHDCARRRLSFKQRQQDVSPRSQQRREGPYPSDQPPSSNPIKPSKPAPPPPQPAGNPANRPTRTRNPANSPSSSRAQPTNCSKSTTSTNSSARAKAW